MGKMLSYADREADYTLIMTIYQDPYSCIFLYSKPGFTNDDHVAEELGRRGYTALIRGSGKRRAFPIIENSISIYESDEIRVTFSTGSATQLSVEQIAKKATLEELLAVLPKAVDAFNAISPVKANEGFLADASKLFQTH